MTTTSKGEERGSKTAETSFIKGTSVNIVALISAPEKLYLKYPDRKPTKLRVEKEGRVFAVSDDYGQRASGKYEIFKTNGTFQVFPRSFQ